MDKIVVDKAPVAARIGCTEEERRNEQRLEVDLELHVQIGDAARTADLGHTVCWVHLTDVLKEFTQGREWVLLEEYTEALARRILDEFPLVASLSLRVWKFPPGIARRVAVEIQRDRYGQNSQKDGVISRS